MNTFKEVLVREMSEIPGRYFLDTKTGRWFSIIYECHSLSDVIRIVEEKQVGARPCTPLIKSSNLDLRMGSMFVDLMVGITPNILENTKLLTRQVSISLGHPLPQR